MNGTSYRSYDAAFGNPIPRPANPNVDGYVFTGWHWTGDTADASSKFDFTGKTVPAGGMDFTAILLSSSDNDLVDLHYRTRGDDISGGSVTAPTIGGSLEISAPGRFTGKGPDGKDYDNSHLPMSN